MRLLCFSSKSEPFLRTFELLLNAVHLVMAFASHSCRKVIFSVFPILSLLFRRSYSSVGWRLGLQQITGLLVTTFLLGTFYRSASLYHPQRRAILHLKTQKRKIKNKDKEKNKLQDDRPPFFEFTTLKSRTVRIILFSALVSHVGIYSPLFFLVSLFTELTIRYEVAFQKKGTNLNLGLKP